MCRTRRAEAPAPPEYGTYRARHNVRGARRQGRRLTGVANLHGREKIRTDVPILAPPTPTTSEALSLRLALRMFCRGGLGSAAVPVGLTDEMVDFVVYVDWPQEGARDNALRSINDAWPQNDESFCSSM